MKTDEKIMIARQLSIVVEMTRKSFHYTLHEEECKHIDIDQIRPHISILSCLQEILREFVIYTYVGNVNLYSDKSFGLVR